MLTSLAYILILGCLFAGIFNRLKLPGLIGMILAGMILSPYALNLLDDSLLLISSDLRQIALIIILTRAGLSLDIKDLKQIGRPAILMSFLPALFEIAAFTLIAPIVLGISTLEGMLMGCVIAAVSPAVIVPRMIKIKNEGYGENKKIPQLILAGASLDDVFVIALFTVCLGLVQTQDINLISLINVPLSILTGIGFGMTVGYVLSQFYRKIHVRDSSKIVVLLAISFLMIEFETILEPYLPLSSLIAVMTMGIALNRFNETLANRLSTKYNKLWVGAEVILFGLVGATVNVQVAMQLGFLSIILITVCLLVRSVGVATCLIKTKLNRNEKLFCIISYLPKATVQAAIGGIPLAMGLACGEKILSVAVISILISAPVGALLIDATYKKFLEMKQSNCNENNISLK